MASTGVNITSADFTSALSSINTARTKYGYGSIGSAASQNSPITRAEAVKMINALVEVDNAVTTIDLNIGGLIPAASYAVGAIIYPSFVNTLVTKANELYNHCSCNCNNCSCDCDNSCNCCSCNYMCPCKNKAA